MSARRRASLGCTLPTRCRVGQPINHSGKLQAPNVGRPSKARYLQCRPYLTVCPSLGLSLSRGGVLRAHMPRTRTGHECSRGRAYASESRCRRMDAWLARVAIGAGRGRAVPAAREGREEVAEAHRCWKTTGRVDPAGPAEPRAVAGADRAVRCADPPPLGRGPGAPAWPAPHVAGGARRRRRWRQEIDR
jgi:hypothetical protein